MKRKLLSTLLLTSLLIISGCGKQDGRTDSWGQPQSYTEIAEKLKNFGITGITDELIQNLESDYAQLPPDVEFDKTANLLTAVGAGTFNAATGTWTPATNGVYCFDIEIYNLTTMYTDFLLGVSSLDKEELDFQNITEDTSQVNWEEGTGKRTVSFTWNGKSYSLEAEMHNDWFDAGVANELGKIIKENSKDKQLFFADDGYQECIVFYRDKEWADNFQKETGLVLSPTP